MASGQNPWDGQPLRSFLSINSGSSSGNGESEQGEKRFFLKAVAIPYKYGGPPLDASSSFQAAQTSGDRRHENSGTRPVYTIATPVTITTSAATRARNGPRNSFNTEQRVYLESIFKKRLYPDKAEMEDIADHLSVTEDKIRKWFTNRRSKEKKTPGTEAPSREASPVQSAPTRPISSSASIAPQAQNQPMRSVAPFHTSLAFSSEREETQSADGVLGSGSVKYRPSVQQAPNISSSKLSLDKAQANRGDPSKKLNASQIATSITPFLRGGSITRKEDVHQLAKIMSLAGDLAGRKYILIILNCTKNQQIHDELAKTTGLAKIVEWIKEARREVDIMDDSNDGDQEARKVLINAVQVLGRAPVELRQDFVGAIKSLTNDQKYPADIVKAASDLLAREVGTGDRYSSRPEASQPQVDGRKRARMDSGSVGSFSEDMALLPKFTKKSASEFATKSTSLSSTAAASSLSSTRTSSSSSIPTAKGGPASRRIDRGSQPLSVITGRNLPPGTTTPASPHSSKTATSPHQPYSPRTGPIPTAAHSPRSANSPRTLQGTFSSNPADKVLERQKDFFSTISGSSNAISTATNTTAATASTSAPTTPVATNPPAATAIATAPTTATKAVKGPGVIITPSGRVVTSALILKHASTKKAVRFRDDALVEVQMVPHRQDTYGEKDYPENDHDRGDDDEYYDDDERDDHRGHDDEDEDERRRTNYDRSGRDHSHHGQHDSHDNRREYGHGYGHGHDEGDERGYAQRYEHENDHGYEHGHENQYDHGHGNEYDEYEQGYRHESSQYNQHPQYYQDRNPLLESPLMAEELVKSRWPAILAFRLPEEQVEQAVRGDLWRPPCRLLIEHPVEEGHKEPAPFGEESGEKNVQEEREKTIAAVHYPDLGSIPPSPAEPDDDMEVDTLPPRKIELFEVSFILYLI
ncbi:hypothetical protein BGW39_009015 [Mortierella sp. 14UC]|nr:hypothetical protein BGW39_009015 [Mortierella sp. 14UC]